MERGSEASCQNLLTFVLPLCKEADFPWLKHILLKILSCVTVLLYLSTIAPTQATSERWNLRLMYKSVGAKSGLKVSFRRTQPYSLGLLYFIFISNSQRLYSHQSRGSG